MRGQPGHTTRPHACLPPSYLGMDGLTTERSFDLQATLVFDVVVLFGNMLSVAVCTTRH